MASALSISRARAPRRRGGPESRPSLAKAIETQHEALLDRLYADPSFGLDA